MPMRQLVQVFRSKLLPSLGYNSMPAPTHNTWVLATIEGNCGARGGKGGGGGSDAQLAVTRLDHHALVTTAGHMHIAARLGMKVTLCKRIQARALSEGSGLITATSQKPGDIAGGLQALFSKDHIWPQWQKAMLGSGVDCSNITVTR